MARTIRPLHKIYDVSDLTDSELQHYADSRCRGCGGRGCTCDSGALVPYGDTWVRTLAGYEICVCVLGKYDEELADLNACEISTDEWYELAPDERARLEAKFGPWPE